ncbi:hypothetical protein KC949_00810 [Candidatus Saccharibacteria bacterium]|nr:hypothetical protein [Candidatus Saccharibacteria bacterium]
MAEGWAVPALTSAATSGGPVQGEADTSDDGEDGNRPAHTGAQHSHDAPGDVGPIRRIGRHAGDDHLDAANEQQPDVDPDASDDAGDSQQDTEDLGENAH